MVLLNSRLATHSVNLLRLSQLFSILGNLLNCLIPMIFIRCLLQFIPCFKLLTNFVSECRDCEYHYSFDISCCRKRKECTIGKYFRSLKQFWPTLFIITLLLKLKKWPYVWTDSPSDGTVRSNIHLWATIILLNVNTAFDSFLASTPIWSFHFSSSNNVTLKTFMKSFTAVILVEKVSIRVFSHGIL